MLRNTEEKKNEKLVTATTRPKRSMADSTTVANSSNWQQSTNEINDDGEVKTNGETRNCQTYQQSTQQFGSKSAGNYRNWLFLIEYRRQSIDQSNSDVI